MSSAIDKKMPGMMGLKNKLFIIFILMVSLALTYEGQSNGVFDLGLPMESPNTIGTYYKVTKVTDGDTIHVQIGENNEAVRLLGINTPETVDPRRPVQCFGKEASKRMQEIVGGKIVRLEYDNTQSLRDAYDRLLAYVYLEDGQMVNKKMIAEGYAYEYTYLHPYKYQTEFREVQKLAEISGRGLWAKDTCNGSTSK